MAARVDGDIEKFTVDVADGRLTRLTNSPGDDRDPTWSPDGSQIAFSSVRDGNTEIYVMRADGTGLRRVTNDPAEDVSPAWSPDGSTIAFASGVGEDRDLFVIHLADGQRERLTTGARVTKDVSRWSPDRAYVAIQTADKGNYDIQLVRMVDHVRTAVAASAGYDGQFSWSSDGRRLAFISDRDGYDAVYVTDVTGAHVRRVTTTASLNPEWEP